ncbi:MAG TPA: response regulator [Terriglobia bacterium]|nr:response regulator [Terriglobia bacterium]
MAGPILIVVDDLIFLSKIQQTAHQMGVSIEPVGASKIIERAAVVSAHSIILDLNHRSGAAIEVARAIKGNPATSRVQVFGFLSHVQTDLAAAAHEAGCDIVLARSAFAQQLPQLLLKLAG